MKKKKLIIGLSLAIGLSFSAFAFADNAEAADMHRLYNPNSGEHFYTANNGEKNNLTKVGWKYEGLGWTAPNSGTPVYRLYNANAGDHHYTLNVAEKNNLVKVGWKYEGIGWYSDTKKTVPLYRAYNPNAKAGSHNYTTNNAEQKMLLKAGWKNEGIAWYGIKKTTPAVTKYTIKVVHKGSDGKTLNTSSTQVEKGKSYTAKAKSFSGYTLKGSNTQTVKADGNKTITFNYTKNVVKPTPTQKYTVSVKYQIEGGKLLTATIDKFSVEKGKSFTATAKTFDFYKVKGNSTQTITVNGDTTITFLYTLKENVNKTELQNLYNKLKGTTKGNYTDVTWKKFQDSLNYAKVALESNHVAQSYVDRMKNELQEAFNNLKTNTPVEKFNVVVAHKGNDGKTLQTETPIQVEKGKQFTGNAKTFSGYTLQGSKSQTVTVNGNTTITFNYTKNVVEDLKKIEEQITEDALKYVNNYRKSFNTKLINLTPNSALQTGANVRAVEIETLYEHYRPNNNPNDAAYEAGYKGISGGENIGRFRNVPLDWIKTQGAQQLVNAWINSPAHASYMLTVDSNDGAVGVHIGTNSNGMYSLYFVFLAGEDTSRPVSGKAVWIKHQLENGKFLANESHRVLEDVYTPKPMTRALIDGKIVDVEAVNVPTVDLTNAVGETQITVTYRLK